MLFTLIWLQMTHLCLYILGFWLNGGRAVECLCPCSQFVGANWAGPSIGSLLVTIPNDFLWMCHMMYHIYNKTVPNNLTNLFKLRSELHHYKTRSALNQCFYTETITTEKKKRSFVTVGSKIWAGLPVPNIILRFKLIKNSYLVFWK